MEPFRARWICTKTCGMGSAKAIPKSSSMDHSLWHILGYWVENWRWCIHSNAKLCQVAGIGRITTWHRTSDQLPLQSHGFLPAATLLAGTAGSTQCPNASDSGHEEISEDLQSTPRQLMAFFTGPDVPNQCKSMQIGRLWGGSEF